MSTYVARMILLVLLFSAGSARAGQLLLTMDLKLNHIVEVSLKQYFKMRLQNNYRKIYVVSRSSGDSTATTVKDIVHDRLPGEPLDILSIQHGPDISLFWDLSMEEFEQHLGQQKVRFVISSGCRMWGSIRYNSQGQVSLAQRNNVVNHIEHLKPQEALLFTNDQSYLIYLTEPLSQLNEKSLSLSGIFTPFFQDQDKINLIRLNDLNNALSQSDDIRAFFDTETSVNPLARPVFIRTTPNKYEETLFTIPSDLWSSLDNLCETLKISNKIRYQNMFKAICNRSSVL
ncbi:MAG TPA: hypothetical protein VN132_03065 [Bdellovibrio sp.]|nr:hypothetical protein [Bdellovibrio sp.]